MATTPSAAESAASATPLVIVAVTAASAAPAAAATAARETHEGRDATPPESALATNAKASQHGGKGRPPGSRTALDWTSRHGNPGAYFQLVLAASETLERTSGLKTEDVRANFDKRVGDAAAVITPGNFNNHWLEVRRAAKTIRQAHDSVQDEEAKTVTQLTYEEGTNAGEAWIAIDAALHAIGLGGLVHDESGRVLGLLVKIGGHIKEIEARPSHSKHGADTDKAKRDRGVAKLEKELVRGGGVLKGVRGMREQDVDDPEAGLDGYEGPTVPVRLGNPGTPGGHDVEERRLTPKEVIALKRLRREQHDRGVWGQLDAAFAATNSSPRIAKSRQEFEGMQRDVNELKITMQDLGESMDQMQQTLLLVAGAMGVGGARGSSPRGGSSGSSAALAGAASLARRAHAEREPTDGLEGSFSSHGASFGSAFSAVARERGHLDSVDHDADRSRGASSSSAALRVRGMRQDASMPGAAPARAAYRDSTLEDNDDDDDYVCEAEVGAEDDDDVRSPVEATARPDRVERSGYHLRGKAVKVPKELLGGDDDDADEDVSESENRPRNQGRNVARAGARV